MGVIMIMTICWFRSTKRKKQKHMKMHGTKKKVNLIHYTMDTTIIAVLMHWQLILMRVMMHGCRNAGHS